MAFCGECGSRLPEGGAVCPACGAQAFDEEAPKRRPPVEPELEGYGAPGGYGGAPGGFGGGGIAAKFGGGAAAYPQYGTRRGIVLAENEKVVRKYLCCSMKRPKCTGSLSVTNKRVFFEGSALTSRVSKEVALDSVSGLDCYYGTNLNLMLLILGGLMILAGLYGLFEGLRGALVLAALAVLALGAFLIFLGIRKSFFLSVYSSKVTGAPIQLGEGIRSLAGNGAVYSLQSRPTPDTDRMLNELGALIQDLQTMGDHAVEKWKDVR